MIRQLPAWVWIGGAFLAAMAGLMNAIAVLNLQHQAVSHLTGSTTFMAVELANGQFLLAGKLLAIIVCFVTGAVLSGAIVGDSTLKLGRRYGGALVLESLMILLAIPLMQGKIFAGDCLIAMACGLQNAMASTYSGAIVRTTHVTGLFTDIGIALGHMVRGERYEGRKIALCAALASGFIIGGFGGALLFERVSDLALLVPGVSLGAIGGVYWWYTHRRRIIDRRELEVHE
jgi:uncharacterized membrane protein YoaK (UPF0700 family)